MYDDELERITLYCKKLIASDGAISILTPKEKNDLADLLQIWLRENQRPLFITNISVN